ncbi:hypothetical protein BC938DRAFT_476001 [Jimgerdemannia flammicorona]|uniref:Swiss Army Knife RNA repair protein HAD domain-containing protein n=1 Tax=Jimgerdemannia flammicorona TaxID=994334 RepID=A0A433QR22_9FUNG|nr:hypothetical protein BC938DRAFT_476001 [Jimgerdemannia flammicorona]
MTTTATTVNPNMPQTDEIDALESNPPAALSPLDPLTPVTKPLLDAQLAASGYSSRNPAPTPTRLDVYDFDGTSFLSPFPNPKLWDPMLVAALMVEGVFGRGWWLDLASLDVGDRKKLRETGWEGWWKKETVACIRKSMSDPNTMTVLLTGRRYHPFHELIPEILASKGLDFDLIGLRPDPVTPGGVDVFQTSLEFKLSFLTNLLRSFPTLREVHMWEDRTRHAKKFDEFLRAWGQKDGLQVKVNVVMEATKRMDEEWEKQVIHGILDKHNARVEAMEEERKRTEEAQTNPVDVVDEQTVKEQGFSFERLAHSKIVLELIPQFTVVRLDPKGVQTLLETTLPRCIPPLSTDAMKTGPWRCGHAGDVIVCAGEPTEDEMRMLGGIGATVRVRVVGIGQSMGRVWAAKVEGLEPEPGSRMTGRLVSRHPHPHVVLAYNPGLGGKRPHGGHVTDWIELTGGDELRLSGTVVVHRAMGFVSTRKAAQPRKREVSIGKLVMLCYPEFKGPAIGKACAEVLREMERVGVKDEIGNEKAIEAIVRRIRLEE